MGASSNPIKNLVETQPFDEPRIIFRRIRGRIVPIVNKKRVGQDFNQVGNAAAKLGAGLTGGAAALGITKRTLKKKSVRPIRKFRKASRVAKRLSRKSGVFDFSKAKNALPKNISLPKKTVGFALRNPLLAAAGLGVALVTAGFTSKAAGFELESRSERGARF